MTKLFGILLKCLCFWCPNQINNILKFDLADHLFEQMEYAIQLIDPLRENVMFSRRTVENNHTLRGFSLKNSTGHLTDY